MVKSSIGIDLGGTKMLLVGNRNGKIVSRKYPTGKSVSFDCLLKNYHDFLEEEKLETISLAVAVPGLVCADEVHECDVLPCLKGIKTDSFSTKYPVKFINDVEAALEEEKKNYSDVDNLTVIMIGTGIGMSMIVDGKIIKGASGFTGELGYMPVHTDKGITFLDNISAGAGLLEQFGNSADKFKEALNSGNPDAVAILERGALFMGIGISSVISLLNPEVIVVGGGTSTYRNYFELMIKSVDKNTLPILREATTISRTTNQGFTVAYGALTIAESIFIN